MELPIGPCTSDNGHDMDEDYVKREGQILGLHFVERAHDCASCGMTVTSRYVWTCACCDRGGLSRDRIEYAMAELESVPVVVYADNGHDWTLYTGHVLATGGQADGFKNREGRDAHYEGGCE
jgi:hypothetical protein